MSDITIDNIIDQITFLNSQSNPDIKQLEYLQNQLHNINVERRNQLKMNKITNDILSFNPTTERMQTFLESQKQHCLIYAPTQVGKTNAVINMIKKCIDYKRVAVIVSCDNKTDQQEQIYSRISTSLMGVNVDLIKCSKKTKKDMMKALNEKLMPIVFCLDNFSQIEKTADAFQLVLGKRKYTNEIDQIVIIHDEGDVVTKSSETYKNISDAARSHEEWVDMIDSLGEKYNIKRIFVTATPENCVIKYDIKNKFIIDLEIPNDYISYKNIHRETLPDSIDDMRNVLQKHIDENTTRDDYGAILYITDRKITSHSEFLNQFKNLSGNYVIHTYNSNGIVTSVPSRKFAIKLGKYLKQKIKPFDFTTITDIPIRDFYQIVKESNIKTCITIGMDMIARGISYCSSVKTADAMTATVMIYKPSNKLHNVALVQTIGRLTGTARPDLQRVLYCTDDVYTNYMNFNINQETYIKKLKENPETYSSNEMVTMKFVNKLTRDIDRKKLKLSIQYEDQRVEGESSYNDEIIDGVKISNLKRWCQSSNESNPAKIIRYLLSQPNMESNLQTLLDTCNVTQHNIDHGRGIRCEYGKIWIQNSDSIQLNSNIVSKIKEF